MPDPSCLILGFRAMQYNTQVLLRCSRQYLHHPKSRICVNYNFGIGWSGHEVIWNTRRYGSSDFFYSHFEPDSAILVSKTESISEEKWMQSSLGLVRVKRHKSIFPQALDKRISWRPVCSDGQTRLIITVLEIAGQTWNFKKDRNSVTFLNLTHRVVKGPTMQAVFTTVWQSQESNMMAFGDACNSSQLHPGTSCRTTMQRGDSFRCGLWASCLRAQLLCELKRIVKER